MGFRDWWRKREADEDEAALEAAEKEGFDSEAERTASNIDAVRASNAASAFREHE